MQVSADLTFNEAHTSFNEKTASFNFIRKLNIAAYILSAQGVKMIVAGQSTR